MKEEELTKEQRLRVEVACIYFNFGGSVAWTFVHLLMLSIFAKYGRPMENDEKTLIENKLIEKFNESNDEELKHERKVKAYRDMADWQVSEIIRTMRSATGIFLDRTSSVASS